MKYRGYTITYNAKPVASLSMDWEFVHDEFDDFDDTTDTRYGYGASEQACRDAIDEQLLDEEEQSA